LGKAEKKYYVIWVIKQNKSYSVLRRVRIKPIDTSVSFGECRHEVLIGSPTYMNGNKLFYFVELSEGHIMFDTLGIEYDPALIHEFVDRKILQQLASNLTSSQWKLNIFLAIFSGIFGGLVGWIIRAG
jgi:hypothetical protein